MVQNSEDNGQSIWAHGQKSLQQNSSSPIQKGLWDSPRSQGRRNYGHNRNWSIIKSAEQTEERQKRV